MVRLLTGKRVADERAPRACARYSMRKRGVERTARFGSRRIRARCGNRPDRTLHDARAEIADQRLHERILRDLLLGLLLALRALRGIERGGRAAHGPDVDVDFERAAEFLGERRL